MGSKEKDKITKRRKIAENTAVFGLLLVAAGLAIPFANLGEGSFVSIFKWVFGAGALIYTAARMTDVSDSDESVRMRRLRRMECWAGIAFLVAAGFWFYNENRFGPTAGTLALLRDTILFSLVGAMIQVISSWMISRQYKKEHKLDKGA